MKHVKLDRIDLKILRELQQDGRMTNVELARRVGISAPPCLRRVRALEKTGYIRGYHADIAPDKMGYGITVFTDIGLSHHSEADLIQFLKQIESLPQIRECYQMTGDSDFLLKVVAEDWEAFQKFLSSILNNISNLQHIKSSPVMRRAKYDSGVPIDDKIAANGATTDKA